MTFTLPASSGEASPRADAYPGQVLHTSSSEVARTRNRLPAFDEPTLLAGMRVNAAIHKRSVNSQQSNACLASGELS